MSRLTIDVTPEQHQTLKALAALEGKTMKQYALERLLPERLPFPEDGDAARDAREGRGRITPDDLWDKPQDELGSEEHAALGNLGTMLKRRADRARADLLSKKTPEQIMADTLGTGSDA